VIVDLSAVDFLASMGIRMLVAASQEQEQLGGKLLLAGPDELTMRILKTTGIDQLVPVHATADEAASAF
jgi:anti-sigma B factor antagonist